MLGFKPFMSLPRNRTHVISAKVRQSVAGIYILSFLLWISSSEASIDQAVENFSRGKELYYELSLDQALDRFKKSQKIYYENMSHLTKGDELYESHLFAALCYFSQNKTDLANEEIRRAWFLNPRRRPDTKLYPPHFVEHTNSVIRGFKDLKRTQLEIHSTPPFATVFINGFQMGLTPLILKDFPAYTHHIKIVLEDFKEWNTKLSPQGSPYKMNARLLPLPDPSWVMKAPVSQTTPPVEIQNILEESSWNPSVLLGGAIAAVAGIVGYQFFRNRGPQSKQQEAPAPQITVQLP